MPKTTVETPNTEKPKAVDDKGLFESRDPDTSSYIGKVSQGDLTEAEIGSAIDR